MRDRTRMANGFFFSNHFQAVDRQLFSICFVLVACRTNTPSKAVAVVVKQTCSRPTVTSGIPIKIIKRAWTTCNAQQVSARLTSCSSLFWLHCSAYLTYTRQTCYFECGQTYDLQISQTCFKLYLLIVIWLRCKCCFWLFDFVVMLIAYRLIICNSALCFYYFDSFFFI